MAEQQKAGSSNAAQIEFWNSAASRAWADQHERMDRAVAEVTKALLELAAPQPGEHVLDIGCGSGTQQLIYPALPGTAWNKRLKESHKFMRLLLGKADMRVERR